MVDKSKITMPAFAAVLAQTTERARLLSEVTQPSEERLAEFGAFLKKTLDGIYTWGYEDGYNIGHMHGKSLGYEEALSASSKTEVVPDGEPT